MADQQGQRGKWVFRRHFYIFFPFFFSMKHHWENTPRRKKLNISQVFISENPCTCFCAFVSFPFWWTLARKPLKLFLQKLSSRVEFLCKLGGNGLKPVNICDSQDEIRAVSAHRARFAFTGLPMPACCSNPDTSCTQFFLLEEQILWEKRLQGKHNSVHVGWPFTDANLHHTDFVSKTRTGIHKQVPNCNPCPRPSALRGYGIKCLPVLQVSEIFFVRLKAAVANNTSGFVDIAEGPLFPFATNTLVCLL